MNKIKLKFLNIFLMFLTISIGCGEASNNSLGEAGGGGTGGSPDIVVGDGYSIDGVVDGQNVQIEEGKMETGIGVYDDGNKVLNSNESITLVVDNYDTFLSSEIKIGVDMDVSAPLTLSLNEPHDLEVTRGHYVTIQFPGESLERIPIIAATIQFTSLGTTSTEIISGLFRVTLEDERGSLSLTFSGYPEFLVSSF